MLNEGKSVAEIYKLLHSVKRFKEFLPKEVPKAEFKVPVDKKGGCIAYQLRTEFNTPKVLV